MLFSSSWASPLPARASNWNHRIPFRLDPFVYRNFAVVPFRLSFWDQFGNEIGVGGRLSVLRKVQPDKARVRKGTGLYGLDKTGKR